MKETFLYKKLQKKSVQCLTCSHYCFISENKRGLCGVKENQNGKLINLTYDRIIACHLDPIEKKPLFHFLPGTFSLSIASVGCNFTCLNCQNYDISQDFKKDANISLIGEKLLPEQIIKSALSCQAASISYTYTEPTVFLEYALAAMKIAKKNKLKNVWVSNGYFSPQTLKTIAPYLDAINVDLKFFDDKLYQKICGAKLKPILENLRAIKKLKIWLEITTLVIPGYTDQKNQFKKIAQFIKKELSNETPCHVSSFYPCYKMSETPPTPPSLITEAIKIGQKIGLKYVYGGNLGLQEDTFCSKCQTKIINRIGYEINNSLKSGDVCPKCGNKIAGVFL
jgi:pyruvate formate lyase activating enzyme